MPGDDFKVPDDEELQRGCRAGVPVGADGLEHVPNSNDHSTVATVRAPLIEEPCVRDRRVWNTKVTRVSSVVEVRAQLDFLSLTEVRGLQDTNVHIVDTVGAENVAARAAHALAGSECLEQCISIGRSHCTAERKQLLD